MEAFSTNDAVLKVWIPERLTARLDWLSSATGASRPDCVREILFEHVYGRVAMQHLQAFARQRHASLAEARSDQRNEPTAKFSRTRVVDLAMLGKSGDDFKLHLPMALKAELTRIADIHGLATSHYVRKALVLALMGERFHADWQAALGRLGAAPVDLNQLEGS